MSSQDPRHTPSDPNRPESAEGFDAPGAADGRQAPSAAGQGHAAPSFGSGGPSAGPDGHGQPYGGQQTQPGGGQAPYGQQPYGGQQQGHDYQYTAHGNYGQATFQQGGQPLNPSDARTWALVAHIAAPVLNLVTAGWIGFLAPLVLWFVFKDRDPLVRNASAGAFNFNVIVGVLNIALWIIGILTLGVGFLLLPILLPILWVVTIVFAVLGAMAANRGQAYKYPIQIPILT